MNARSRTSHAGWWRRLALATGLTVGALALQTMPAEAAPVGPETALTGLTSQGFPSYFRISPNGKAVQASVIALGMSCASGASFATPDQLSYTFADGTSDQCDSGPVRFSDVR
jgi:hypothetical protein